MTPWELRAQIAGWNRLQGGDEQVAAPSDAEHDALMEKYG